MRRIRVLYFVGSFEQGGAERQVAELVKNLARERFEAHVAVCNAADDLGYDLPIASLHDLRSPRGPNVRTFVRLVRLVRALEPDIVHAVHDPQNSYARLAVLVAHRGDAVASLRCTHLPSRTIRRERLTHRFGSALIVNALDIRDELERRAGIAAIDVIENGVDGRRFVPLEASARARARDAFGMRGETFVVPGRIAVQKNQVAVLRAVASLRSRGAWPPLAHVILAGRVEAHDRYVHLVDATIDDLRLGDVVRRLEPVRDAERLLASADAMLLPSRFEGLPNVVLESLACGTPAIVSRRANAAALVRDGITGFELDGDADAQSVERGMQRFFATSANDRLAIGDAARTETLARFDVMRMVDATCAVYERIARNVSHSRRRAA